ncbi:MAG: ABC transporter permease [Rhodospirillaceae bacterium]|nr:ABC transporter permease [Rhodospirillaceae bacterium]
MAAAVVAILALGSGINATVLTALSSVLLTPLPFVDDDRLVRLRLLSNDDRESWLRQTDSFQGIDLYTQHDATLTTGDAVELRRGARITSTFFQTIGVPLHSGLSFAADDNRSASDVTVVGYSLSMSLFGTADAVGEVLVLDGRNYTVVGVTPEGFAFPAHDTEFWLPLPAPAEGVLAPAVARLTPHATLQQAAAEAAVMAERFGRSRDGSTGLRTLREIRLGDLSASFVVLQVAATVVLLAACLNVAWLLLAGYAGRRQEFLIRHALGARRAILLRQVLAECAALSVLGVVAGLLVGAWGEDLLWWFIKAAFPELPTASSTMVVVVATLATSVVVAVVLALVVYATLLRSMAAGERTVPARSVSHAAGVIVVCEVALCLTLVVTAGLLGSSLWHLVNLERGYDPRDVLTFDLFLPENRYPESRQRRYIFEQVRTRLRALPGVRSVDLASATPLTGRRTISTMSMDGQFLPFAKDGAHLILRAVTAGYFPAVGMSLVQGRLPAEADVAGAPFPAVVSETFARHYLEDGDVLGRRLSMREDLWEVVGVVGDVTQGLHGEPFASVYILYDHLPKWAVYWDTMLTVSLRTVGDPPALASAIRARLSQIDPSLSVGDIGAMDQVLWRLLAPRRLYAVLLGVFGIVVVALAGVGVSGVTAHAVSRRVREIGIRQALGASRRDVLQMVMRRGLLLTALGIVAGLVLCWVATRFLSHVLYGVEPLETTIVGAGCLIVFATAAVGCYVPARRAAKIGVADALREQQ